jgi:hypothetical protein
MSGEELRASWQARVIVGLPESYERKILESVISHNWDDAFPALMNACDTWVYLPHLISAGKISRGGKVFARWINEAGSIETKSFGTLDWLTTAMRKAADRVRLSDAERTAMFAAIARWIVCDFRLDPTMDPFDPDAKHLKPRLH